MRRILTALVLLCTSGNLFAATCSVESGPGPELAKYLADASRIVATTSAAARSGTCGIGTSGNASSSIERFIDTSIAAKNRATTPDNTEASARYYTELTMLGGIPPVFKRDIQAVESLDRSMQRAYEASAKACGLGVNVDLAPLGNISLSVRGSVNDIFSDLITTNSIILDNLRSAPAPGNMAWTLSSSEKLKVKDASALIAEIRTNYDDGANIDACQKISKANENSFETVEKSFKDAFDFSKGAKAWNDAAALMRNMGKAVFGERDAAYKEKEKKILGRELARQGVSANQSARIMGSINSSSPSYDGAVGDTLGNIGKFAGDITDKFTGAFYQALGPLTALYDGASNAFSGTTSTIELPQILANKADLEATQKVLITQYTAMNARMSIVSNSSTDSVSALANMHAGLIQSTNYVKSVRKESHDVCQRTVENVSGNCKP